MKNPWTNVYGAARSVLAIGVLVTLVFSGIDILFQPGPFKAVHDAAVFNRISIFYLLADSRAGLEAARWIAIGILLVVASGWRPRVTGILHWWITFSFSVSTSVADGGDQISAILTLLLIPVTLMDPRRWHWTSWSTYPSRLGQRARALIAGSCFLMIRLQVAVIYFHAGVSKLFVEEWANGTAMYYWFTHPVYGMNEVLASVTLPLFSSAIGVTALTWAVMLLEITLAAALVMDKKYWPPLLWLGMLFHVAIIFGHGLFSFFFAMAGALILYLRPYDEPFTSPLKGLARISRGVRLLRRGRKSIAVTEASA